MTTQAKTRSGSVEGLEVGAHVAFRGIPFAKPPVGKLRFKAPEPPEPWAGTRSAKEYSASALQGAPLARGTVPDGPQSEDCLYLNVYTPAADGKRRPVLFWVHGGAFVTGSASMPLYDGGRLAERGDVVVVTTNYRLGALGFLCLGERGAAWGATANAGILDQITALRWVHENIEQFGGDPENVTIFGESAGGTSISTFLVAPAARGLFHKAIAESAAPALVLADPKRAEKIANQLLESLGIGLDDTEKLQSVDVERLLTAQAAVEGVSTVWRGFFPVFDRATLPDHPRDVFASGKAPPIPLLMGTNRDEWNLFLAEKLFEIDNPMDDSEALVALGKLLPDVDASRRAPLLAAYQRARSAAKLRHGNRALLAAIQGDRIFRIPSVRFLEAYRAVDPRTYAYLFTHVSPFMDGILGSCHALELPFVFGTLDAPLQSHFAGKGPEMERLSHAMMDAWLAFAKTANPNHPAIENWPTFDPERRATMVFDTHVRVENAPLETERAAWDGIP